VDESSVEVLHIVSGPDSIARNSHVDSYRYPKAGINLSLNHYNFLFPIVPYKNIVSSMHLCVYIKIMQDVVVCVSDT